ncbi:MAG: hypothetical protein HKM02_10965 [Pseudomonadales bacterium]|nr:hypothetical protein [Pseudomonadales bacterium]
MSKESVIGEIHNLFEAAVLTMFESFGCEIKRILEPPYELTDVPLASMDAGSQDIEVMIFISMPLPILALTYPSSLERIIAIDESTLEAWFPELANQLMGKLKNKLILYGCNLQMGLPNSYFGKNLSEVLPEGYDHATFYFDVDGEVFETCLSINIFNEDMVVLSSGNVDTGPDDGELELF